MMYPAHLSLADTAKGKQESVLYYFDLLESTAKLNGAFL